MEDARSDDGRLAEHNVEVTYETEEQARAAADAAREAGVDAAVSVGEPEDERAVLRAEMRDELESAVVGPGNVGPFTKSMSRGIALWVPMGSVAGLALGLVLAVLFWRTATGFVWTGIIGVVGGATFGFVVGGGFKPRADREGEELDAEAGVTVGVHASEASDAERAEEVLRGRDPKRVDRVDRSGHPLGPSSEDKTRPVGGDD